MAPSIPSKPEGLEQLGALADWIAAAAFPLGLTNYRDPSVVLNDAMLPALALPELLEQDLNGHWAEIGAGSGALGLTLALCYPHAYLTLVDRRQRATSFIDLTIHRFGIPNARALLADLRPGQALQRYDGVCLRAVAAPVQALAIAADHAHKWICAWHSPHIREYAAPPPGFQLVAQRQTTGSNLVATLYLRSCPADAAHAVPIPEHNLRGAD